MPCEPAANCCLDVGTADGGLRVGFILSEILFGVQR